MAKLIYTAITSLDGYTADATGSFDWSTPDEEVHAHVNDGERAIGTYLYGRRMYEVMGFWEVAPLGEALTNDPEPLLEDEPDEMRDYAAIWRAADKIVYSSSLDTADTERTRIERSFDPDAVRALKESSDQDLSIGGPTLAALAIRAGLVDEFAFYISPVIIGGGLAALPSDVQVDLTLLESRTFGNGVVFARYAVTS